MDSRKDPAALSWLWRFSFKYSICFPFFQLSIITFNILVCLDVIVACWSFFCFFFFGLYLTFTIIIIIIIIIIITIIIIFFFLVGVGVIVGLLTLKSYTWYIIFRINNNFYLHWTTAGKSCSSSQMYYMT